MEVESGIKRYNLRNNATSRRSGAPNPPPRNRNDPGPTDHNFHGAGLKHQQQFKQWWSSARQSEEPPSPYDFLVNFGLPELKVQVFLCEVLKKCWKPPSDCGFGAGPGSLDYFAWHCWSRVGKKFNSWDIKLGNVMRRDDTEQLASEQDMLTLIDVSRQNFILHAIKDCLIRNYSSGFMQALIQTVPEEKAPYEFNHFEFDDLDKIGSPGRREALDSDCVLGFSEMLPHLKVCRLGGTWRKEAFVECLSKLLPIDNLQRLEICLPNCPVEEDKDVDPGTLKRRTVGGKQEYWLAKTLVIKTDVTNLPRPWTGAGFLALDCIPNMHWLTKLKIECYALSLSSVTPRLLALLTGDYNHSLQELSIVARPTSKVPTKSAVLDILEALRGNECLILAHFRYLEDCSSDDPVPFESQLYLDKLLEVVEESNDCLSTATIAKKDGYRRSWTFPTKSKIDYYLSLNRNGRVIARDPNCYPEAFVCECLETFLEEGVPLHVEEDEDYPEESFEQARDFLGQQQELWNQELWNLNVLFGLLRELPQMWSASTMASQPTEGDINGRKRKRRNSSTSSDNET